VDEAPQYAASCRRYIALTLVARQPPEYHKENENAKATTHTVAFEPCPIQNH
jgi:hypothetical protein